MTEPRIGELFAGYGGLGMGVQRAIGGEIAWVSEFDKGANKILAHRFPGVPNHGDITKIDWATVEPVDVLTGGSPCQDLSHAGKRSGMTEGTRSNLWVAMREAIAQLRPGLVVWENVRGAYSAAADSEVEPCAGCVGDGPGVHLRALGRVLGDLSDLGYDARWHGLRAADIGAPHGRFRVFVVAYPQRGGLDGWAPDALGRPLERDTASRCGEDAGRLSLLPTPAVNDMGEGKTVEQWDEWTAKMKAAHGNGNGHGASLAIEAQRLLPTPMTTDHKSNASPGVLARHSPQLCAIDALLPTPTSQSAKHDADDRGPGTLDDHNLWSIAARIAKENDDALPAEAGPSEVLRHVRGAVDSQEVQERTPRGQECLSEEAVLWTELREHSDRPDPLGVRMAGAEADESSVRGVRHNGTPARSPQEQELVGQPSGEPGDAVCLMPPAAALAGGPRVACGCGTAWGQYEAAIRRWESVLGRCAPPPTILSKKGTPQLSAAFSEFLMGLPAGWVTDVPGITRNEALKALGNGVVPQQCAAALRVMLCAAAVEAVA